MAGNNLPKAPNDKPLTDGDGLDGRRPDGDDAANKPDGKPKAPGAEGNADGRPAGKQPGGRL